MSSQLLTAVELRALKRPMVQKLAKREGVRANGKTEDIIAALLDVCPNGVEPLEPVAEPVRRSKRLEPTAANAAANEGEIAAREGEPAHVAEPVADGPIYGDSISQYVPARTRTQPEVAPAAPGAGPSLSALAAALPRLALPATSPASISALVPPTTRFAAPPPSSLPAAPSPPPSPPSPTHVKSDDKPVSSSSSGSSRSARLGQSRTGEEGSPILAPRPESRLPFSLTSVAQGSSRSVSYHGNSQQRDQVHLTGASNSTAATNHDNTRNLDGASHFASLLKERGIKLTPPSTADSSRDRDPVDVEGSPILTGAGPSLQPRTPPAAPLHRLQANDDLGSLPPSSPPGSSPLPEPSSPVPSSRPKAVPPPVFALPPLAPLAEKAGRAGPPLPRLSALSPRPPVFSMPSPPPATQPTAGPCEPQPQPERPKLRLSEPFRFGPIRPRTPTSPGSATESAGSTASPSPSPEPAPEGRRPLRREGAHAHLDVGLPSSPDVPRLLPATFSSQPNRRPLRREAAFRLSPSAPAEQRAQLQAGPSKPAVVRAGPARHPAQFQAGPSTPLARAPVRQHTTRPTSRQAQAAKPRHPAAAPMRVRDPLDSRFFMPLLPTEDQAGAFPGPHLAAQAGKQKPWVVGKPPQQPTEGAGEEGGDKILQIAERLGLLDQVRHSKRESARFAPPSPPPAAAPVTADEDQEGRLPIALDLSSSSAEAEAEEAGADASASEQREAEGASEPAGDEDEDYTPRYSAAQKGKGRATDDGGARRREARRGVEQDKNDADDGTRVDQEAQEQAQESDEEVLDSEFFATLDRCILPEIERAESLPPEDLRDKILELLEEAERQAGHQPPAAAPPAQDDGPAHEFEFDHRKVKGCTGEQMRKITYAARARAEKVEKIRQMRRELEAHFVFLFRQTQLYETLRFAAEAKRLVLEHYMNLVKKATKKRSRKAARGEGGSAGDGGDGGDGGAGGNGGRPTSGGNDSGAHGNEGGEVGRRDSGDEDRGNEASEEESQAPEGGSEKENEGPRDAGKEVDRAHTAEKEKGRVVDKGKAPATSKVSGKSVAPPVAAGQRAAQRMARRLEQLASAPEAGPSSSQTAPTAPALLPAWDADAAPGAKTGWESSSDSNSSPPPILRPAFTRLPSPRMPVTPPIRSSAPMRRNMENARIPLSELPGRVARLSSIPIGRQASELLPLISLARMGTVPPTSLSGAFTFNALSGPGLFGGGSSHPIARAGETTSQELPKPMPQPAEDDSESSTPSTSSDAADNDEGNNDGPVTDEGRDRPRPAYLPLRVPGYDARQVPFDDDYQDEDEEQQDERALERDLFGSASSSPSTDGTEESDDPDEVFCRDDLELEIFGEDEPEYEHAAPYEGMFRGFRNLRGEEVAE